MRGWVDGIPILTRWNRNSLASIPRRWISRRRLPREGNSDSLVVVRGGKLAFEQYWNGKTREDVQQTYSATKSPFSFIIGRAIQRGYIKSLDQPIVELVPELKGHGREQLTFRNILAMESGLEQSRELDAKDAQDAVSQLEAALRKSVTHEPYAWYHYNNAAYRLMFTALERASGKSIPELTHEELFEPLGMYRAYWVELVAGAVHKGYQSIRMRPIDLAKIGQVILNHGEWAGEQYLPAEYIAELTEAPAPKANPSYGLFWHLNSGDFFRSFYESDRVEGNLLPGTPPDAVANFGSRGQIVVAIPSLKHSLGAHG